MIDGLDMSDSKTITGLAESADGKRRLVSITEREGDSEIFEDWEMEMMLTMSCAKQGLRLLEVREIKYV